MLNIIAIADDDFLVGHIDPVQLGRIYSEINNAK
jgi:hypothetical protein